MGAVKNLESGEALNKLKSLAEEIRVCMFCTNIYNMPFGTRPMEVQEVDEDGSLWFLSADRSLKNIEISENNKVQLIFSDPDDSKFLSVTGMANIIEDKDKIREVWSTSAKPWFPEGLDDPALTLLKVKPDTAHYWDTKKQVTTILNLIETAVTGKQVSENVQGDLDV